MRDDLFGFMKDKTYRLMLDMAKETHSKQDTEEVASRFRSEDVDHFYAVCHEHGLDGVVGAYAHTIGLELGSVWEKEYISQKERLEFLRKKAIEICHAMRDKNISMVILKNGGIMIDMIENAVKCPMEDIDSLIFKEDFYEAHQVLLDNGFVFKFRSAYEAEKLEEAYRDGSTEYYIPMPNGEKMWFELSWRVISGRWIRPDLEPDTHSFMERSSASNGTDARILAPEDNLLQVCIHTAKHSYVRAPGLRLHMDVDRIIAHNEIDWALFLTKVSDAHVKTSTYLSLYIPTVLFGTKVPQSVLDELKPKNAETLLKLLGSAGMLHPREKKFSRVGYIRFQTALYDRKVDMLRVLYPGKKWMMERYCCRNARDLIAATLKRAFDLAGIRIQKQ